MAASIKNLIRLIESVRKEGFHVSNLYWRVNQFFNENDVCPNADYFARRIVNTWVDASVDEEYVKKCASVINKKLHELEQ